MPEKRIMIVGGGLSGLVTAIHLARNGITSTVIERQQYPFHRVCGEYISNEVVPYLKSLGAFPEILSPSHITRFQLTSTRGHVAELPLDLGGFGVSRFALDYFLFQLATKLGVRFALNTEVTSLTFENNAFSIETTGESYSADVVIGCYGKRSRLDKQLDRSFIHRHSPYVGVKYHVRIPAYPDNLITLHNFSNGYCGISRVEGGVINVCYLTHRDNVRAHGSIRAMEEAVLFRNPFIQDIFEQAEFLFERPETINEISFETKGPVDNHILMGGDAAGMITPLCGNGMAIAIHSAKLISEHILRYIHETNYNRDQLEHDYAAAWTNQFATRLWAGRNIQRLFGHDWPSNLAVQLARHVKPAAAFLMKKTHGNPF